MKTKITQAVLAGIIATVAMTAVIFMGSLMGMPKMSPPSMLSAMMKVPAIVGWLMHFMIGIIYALAYIFLLFPLFKSIKSKALDGIIFGLAVFVFALIMMVIMGFLFHGIPMPQGNMMVVVAGAIFGHLVYGIVVSYTIKAA